MTRLYDEIKDIFATKQHGIEYIGSRPVYKYMIFLAPQRPTDSATFYGSTPILEQCKNVVRCLEEQGEDVLVKCITTGGKEVYLIF